MTPIGRCTGREEAMIIRQNSPTSSSLAVQPSRVSSCLKTISVRKVSDIPLEVLTSQADVD